MGTTLRDVLDWFGDVFDWVADLRDGLLRTIDSAFYKLFDLQILDITFGEWLIIGAFGFIILSVIANWRSIFGSER